MAFLTMTALLDRPSISKFRASSPAATGVPVVVGSSLEIATTAAADSAGVEHPLADDALASLVASLAFAMSLKCAGGLRPVSSPGNGVWSNKGDGGITAKKRATLARAVAKSPKLPISTML